MTVPGVVNTVRRVRERLVPTRLHRYLALCLIDAGEPKIGDVHVCPRCRLVWRFELVPDVLGEPNPAPLWVPQDD